MNDPATAPQPASRTLVTAIVSTAAPGAESGALDAAIELGIGYGGRTAADELPPIYASRMRGVSERGMAVRLNVQDSDGTLIVSFASELTGRSKHAGDQCKAQRKPAKHLVLTAGSRTRIPDAVRVALLKWIDDSHISVLHVVGPGEEQDPGIAEATRDVLVWVLEDDHAADTGFAADIDVLAASRVDPKRVFDLAAQRQRELAAAAVVLGGILSPFAGVDRSASPESLQHVADPAGVDWGRAADRMAASEPPPLGTTPDRPILVPPKLYAELERGLSSRRPATVPLTPSSLAALARSIDATGALTTERRTELEASIRQAESEIRESAADPEGR